MWDFPRGSSLVGVPSWVVPCGPDESGPRRGSFVAVVALDDVDAVVDVSNVLRVVLLLGPVLHGTADELVAVVISHLLHPYLWVVSVPGSYLIAPRPSMTNFGVTMSVEDEASLASGK